MICLNPKRYIFAGINQGKLNGGVVGSYEAACAAGFHPTTLFERIRKGSPDRQGRTYDVFDQDI